MSISERNMVDLLFPYVRSVLGAKNTETPEFIGSGIILQYHDVLYLITAAHVMDHFDGKTYSPFLDGVDNLVAISGNEISSYTEHPIRRRDDKHDISIVKLNNVNARFDPKCFIEIKKMDITGKHDPLLGYFCVGVPAKRGDKSVKLNERLICPEPYGLRANESNINVYEKLNASKLTHLALHFDLKRTYSKDNVKRTAPALNGLSGAPIWGFRRKSDTEIQAVIVAILTEHHQKDIKAILGTRVSEIIPGISL